jgi:hypothetical protein
MKVLLIANDGGGFADNVEVADGTTVARLFEERFPARKSADYLVRINRQPAAADQVLQPGDRISFTPVKIQGAVA